MATLEPSPPLVATHYVEGKPADNEIEEVPAPSDPEIAGQPPSEELTGFKAWWSRWGFEVKLIIALLLPVFVEVSISFHAWHMSNANLDNNLP